MASEAVLQWASDWADEFDQGYDEEKLRAMVGNKIRVTHPVDEEDSEDARVVEVDIVGFCIDTIVTDEADVHRFSVISSTGLQVMLKAGLSLEHLKEE